MKNIKVSILAALAVLSITAFTARAQTNTIPSFFTSVENYVTTENTNFSFDNVKLDVETGYKQATGVGSASFTKLGYYVTPAIELDASIGYFGVGSAINSFQAGVGYAIYQKYDVRITANLDAGYDSTQRAGVIEPGLEIKKKLSANTYSSLGISLPYFVGKSFNTSPTFTIGVGFTM